MLMIVVITASAGLLQTGADMLAQKYVEKIASRSACGGDASAADWKCRSRACAGAHRGMVSPPT